MGMKTCKDCGTEVSKSAKVCPKCGRKLKSSKLGIFIGVIIIFIGIVGIAGGANNSNDTTTSSSIEVVSKQNYDKIAEGMTEQEVEEILGEPSSISENTTPGIGTMILKHFQEPLSLKAIDVYFVDGKVYMKNWTDL